MAISNLVLTLQIYSEETNGAHAHNRDRVPLIFFSKLFTIILSYRLLRWVQVRTGLGSSVYWCPEKIETWLNWWLEKTIY